MCKHYEPESELVVKSFDMIEYITCINSLGFVIFRLLLSFSSEVIHSLMSHASSVSITSPASIIFEYRPASGVKHFFGVPIISARKIYISQYDALSLIWNIEQNIMLWWKENTFPSQYTFH